MIVKRILRMFGLCMQETPKMIVLVGAEVTHSLDKMSEAETQPNIES